MTDPYEILIEAFLAKRLTAGEFETCFLHAFKNEPEGMSQERFHILDGLFGALDAYSPDCQAGTESAFEISESELRVQAAKTLEKLRNNL